nr:hypothetical protein BaRGS_015799 [Batillaria attramentaria]
MEEPAMTSMCADDKIGDGCKDLSVNFDLVLRPSSNYMTSELTTFPLNSLALTVSTWVRFTDRTSPGTMLSLYGLNSENSVNNPQQLLHFEKDRVVLSFAGSRTFDFTPPIDDGYWHHVVLSWDGSTGQATLYIDNTVSASTTNYGEGSRLVPVGWLVLGGRYNTTTDTVDRSAGMAGRLSRLHISTEALSSSDVSSLYADFSLVPSGAQRALTKHLLKGAYSAVDYNSQLTLGYCRTQSGCRSIDQGENIGWGDYGVWYAQSDDDGDTATFASTILSSLVITETKTCSSGTVLLGDCCSQYYFSILFLYVGSNCLFGRYFNYTTGQCELCPAGFYSENPGAFYCEACPFDETTAHSTEEEVLQLAEIILVVLAIIIVIIIVFLILFCCFRDHIVKACPCLITKVKPEEKTGWGYVDRFGETKMKFVTYRLSDLRARNSDKDLLEDSVEEGSVHTNISLQIPVFEEKLNGQVKKKSVHMSDHISEQKTKKKKKRRARRTADLNSQEPAPLSANRSRIMIDSDEDER